jgi:hypothetical protein
MRQEVAMSHHDRFDNPQWSLAALLDEAHRDLPAPELAQVLLGVERAAAPLSDGEPPREARAAAPGASAEVQGHLSRLVGVLSLWADRDGGRPPARARQGEWVRHYLDDVAARPRGAALPAPSG